MKKNFNYILSLIGLIFLFIINVSAATITSITVEDGDLIHITADPGTNGIKGYLVGVNSSTATSYPSNSNNVKISVPNGTYTVWVVDNNGRSTAYPLPITVTSSCTDQVVNNATGTGNYTRCFKTVIDPVTNNPGTPKPVTSGDVVNCASGYYLNVPQSIMENDECTRKSLLLNGVLNGQRYCTRTYKYVCDQGASSSLLSNLTISSGTLSPSFSSNQASYSATVSSNVSSITIGATTKDPNATFESGYGPRTVNLNYGKNVIDIKVISSSKQSSQTYRLTITRPDNRSTNNNLKSLNVSAGNLTPKFSSNTIKYNVTVSESVSELTIDATLADASSSFVNGYGPRTVNLNYGLNTYQIRVKNQEGAVKTYTLNITRNSATSIPTNPENPNPTSTSKALLKSLELNDGALKLEFDKNIFNYNVYVPYDTVNILAIAESEDPTDTIIVEGGSELQVGENELKITVSSSNGNSNVYTLYIIRREEGETISTNSYLSNLEVKGRKIKFDAKEREYSISLKEGETELDITATPADKNSVITIEGNENLKVGSQIKITVTAENGSVQEYYLNITGIKKSANVFLIIIVVIIIILVIAYLVLRIMGYRIYFNFDGIKSMLGSNNKKKRK